MPKSARDRQKEIYTNGVSGTKPLIPTDSYSLESKAKKILSQESYAYIAGGAGLESTINANRAVWEKYKLVPRMLQSDGRVELSTKLFNQTYPRPLFLCPIGVLELAHPSGDLGVAEACKECNIPMMVSNQASHSMEKIAKVLYGSDWYFQLYVSKSDDLALNFIKRAEQAGAKAIIITLDTTLLGWRNRDLNLAYLPFLKGKGIAQYTSDPVFNKIADEWPNEKTNSQINLTAIKHLVGLASKLPGKFSENVMGKALQKVRAFTQIYSRPDLNWDTIEKLKTGTTLPIILKGIQHTADAQLAIDHGVDAIYISNHGGRQVDGAISSLDALENIKKLIGSQIPILFDSGVRCGADILKALALGADMVGIGRPYVFALAIAGSKGVKELIENFTAELELTMSLCGIHSIEDCRAINLEKLQN